MRMDIMKTEILRNAINYLKIIEDMQKTNPDWYLKEFRGHDDWSIGLTYTISEAEEWLGIWDRNEWQGEEE